MDEIRYFLRSLLGQLAHAHSVGINNLDLSGDRNVFVDHDGSAILFDWNGAIAVGEKSFNEEHNFGILPPEAWIEQLQGHEMKMMSISAFDVWSVGVMFARLIYYPCRWTYQHSSSHLADRLKETIMALGGNTAIPVDNELTVDLADEMGINGTLLLQDRQFQPLLGRKCTQSTFPLLEGSTEEDKQQALDFLQSIMKISPLDRPDCRTLLLHPFLDVK